MKIRRIGLVALIVLALAACAPRMRDALGLGNPECDRLYLVDQPADSSMGDRPHTPPEAQPPAAPPEGDTAPEPSAEPGCLKDLPLLPTETVVDEAFEYTSRFLLRPSGQGMVLTTSGVVILLSLATGGRETLELEGFPQFWADEETLVYSVSDGEGVDYFAHDLDTGGQQSFTLRWEYNDVPAENLTASYYTGWQASEILEVGKRAICKAVRDGRLKTVEAEDGSLLLLQEDLLEHGADLIREEHPKLYTYDEIAEMRNAAEDVRSVIFTDIEAPIRHGYWHKILVMTGLPRRVENLLVNASSESHWQDYPHIANQLEIDHGGGSRWLDIGGEYFVERDSCTSSQAQDYPYVLHSRRPDGKPVVVGRIPYSIDYWARMVWAPDGRHIYLKHPIDGRWVVSRLSLHSYPEFQPTARAEGNVVH